MTTLATAQGSRSQLLYKKQSALGTVATGNYSKLRYNTHDLKVPIATLESQELRSDREVVDMRHGGRHGMGGIEVDLCYSDHDDLIESAMFNTFDTDSITIGTTPQYLSIEDGQLDISQFQMFQDMIASSMQLTFAPNEIVKAAFQMVGTNGKAMTSATAGGTAVAASSNQPFDAWNGAIFDNAAETGDEIAIITQVQITVENSVSPSFVVGQQTPLNLQYGRGRVSGQLTAHFYDSVWVNRFLGEYQTPIVLNLTDPDGNGMEFRMGTTKLTAADRPVQNENERLITLPFMAQRDATVGSALQISIA